MYAEQDGYPETGMDHVILGIGEIYEIRFSESRFLENYDKNAKDLSRNIISSEKLPLKITK